MDFRAANEHQQEARWRVFLMFVIMALMVIRTGLVSRGVIAIFPADRIPQDVAQGADHQRSSVLPADVRQATLVLLCLAEAAGRLVILKERAVWELMTQPPLQPAQEQRSNVAKLCDRSAQRLDSS